jgi:hypothetical protein
MNMDFLAQAMTLIELAGEPLKAEIAKCEADPGYDPGPAVGMLAEQLAAAVVLPPEPTRRVMIAVCDAIAGQLEQPAPAESH